MQNEPIKKTKSALSSLIILPVVLVVAFIAISFLHKSTTETLLKIGDSTLRIEIAKTQNQKETGLCCRTGLDENAGMLFVYDKPGIYHFWMKDTKIPLDMYWIDAQKTIIFIEHSVQPESYPKSFGPETSAQYILETNAGYAKTHNITIGETVIF